MGDKQSIKYCNGYGGKGLEILISFQSKDPIYKQIVMQVKKKVLDGSLKPGSCIPAMRSLAKDLNVSVITVQKAYEILRDEGFINTVIGKGTFIILPEMDDLKISKKTKLITEIQQAINFAYVNGYSKEEIFDIFKHEMSLFDEKKKEEF